MKIKNSQIFFAIGLMLSTASFSFEKKDECQALFYDGGVIANFPLLKSRSYWEWYKYKYPEYMWRAETGFYKNKKFTSNGFGISASVGTLNIGVDNFKKGNMNDLLSFATKNAYLTKESEYYLDQVFRDKILYSTGIFAVEIDNEAIMIGSKNTSLFEMARVGNPTHMKLQAILPEKSESYTCYPKIKVMSK